MFCGRTLVSGILLLTVSMDTKVSCASTPTVTETLPPSQQPSLDTNFPNFARIYGIYLLWKKNSMLIIGIGLDEG
jgi:hypothetical protein